jgi:Cu-Zn family superoxide dismutase
VFGSVIFEQQTALGDVTVRVEIEGLRPGFHGFHVHQYGDVRSTSDLTTISAHFVPYCAPPNIDENGQQVGGCEEDQVHGLPPNATRQPGDMGNLEVGPDGSLTQASRVLTIGQSKMSLSDPLRSIIGRTILIHAERDDGSQPYGNAGGPEAYGVIGLASTPVGGSNNAQAPQIPHVTKVICTFQSDSSTPINPTLDGQPTQIAPGSVGGSALLQLMEPHQPGVVRMQARLLGLTRHSTHSFHFHSWGDMTVGLTNGALGPIYAENAIVVEHVEVNNAGFGIFDEQFASDTLLQHVGRSLTIHEGPDSSSPTIAAATCGIAHPHAVVETPGAQSSVIASVSPGVAILVSCLVVFGLIFLCVSCLYYYHLPIPCCGKYLYLREGHMQSVPPPPPMPPPPGGGVTMEAAAPQAPYGVRVEKL